VSGNSGPASQVLRTFTLPETIPDAPNCKSYDAFYFEEGATYSKAPTASNKNARRLTFHGTPTKSQAYIAFTPDEEIDDKNSMVCVPTIQGMKRVGWGDLGHLCMAGTLNDGNSGYGIGAGLWSSIMSGPSLKSFKGSQAVLFGPDNVRGELKGDDFVVEVD
jgi:hypothetical protein